MTLVLPTRLASTFALSSASHDDLADVYDLVVAETTAVLGHCHDTAEDVRAWLEPPEGADSTQLLVRDTATGSLRQWWSGVRLPGDPRFLAWVRTHSDVPVSDGDELTRAAWQLLLPWVKELARVGASGDILVHSGCLAGDDAALRRLQEVGFVHERTFWEMAGAVADEPEAIPTVDGLVLKPADDHRIVHRVLMEGFADHWGFRPLGYDDWLATERGQAGYAPDLWLLAELHAKPVAVMLLSRRAAAENGLYVQEIATLAAYRRLGIASRLLHEAFDIARREGFDHVALHVDSDNADGAPGVYQRAGFGVRDAFNACLLRMPAGGEASSP